MTDELTPVLTANWADERAWKLTNYERRGGYQALRKAVEVSGPLPAPQPRRQARWRFQLVAMASERAPLHAFLASAVDAAYAHARDRALRWSVDVDPLDFG